MSDSSAHFLASSEQLSKQVPEAVVSRLLMGQRIGELWHIFSVGERG